MKRKTGGWRIWSCELMFKFGPSLRLWYGYWSGLVRRWGAYLDSSGYSELKLWTGPYTYWAPDMYDEDSTYHLFVVSWVYPHKTLQRWARYSTIHWEIHVGTFVLACDRLAIGYGDWPWRTKLANNTYRIWFKHENAGYTTHYADSEDLLNWILKGPAIDSTICEGANVLAGRIATGLSRPVVRV